MKLKNVSNKNKIIIGIGTALIVVALISTTYFVFNSKKVIDTKQVEIFENHDKEIQGLETEEDVATKELEEAKKNGDEKAIKEATDKVARVREKKNTIIIQMNSNFKTDRNVITTAKTGREEKTSTSNNTQTTPKEPEKKKVWVVDKPAWTEEVKEPVYVSTWWVKLEDNKTLKIFYSEREAYDYARNNGLAWGSSPKKVPDPSGKTRVIDTIHHPEQGHWEYR